MAERRDYEIGYGKPPTASRFQKGQSGNPKGRRKGSLNAATMMRQLVMERVSVVENGREKAMSMLEFMLRQMVRKGAKGDLKSTQLVLRLVEQGVASEAEEVEDENDDLLIQSALLKMRQEMIQGAAKGEPAA